MEQIIMGTIVFATVLLVKRKEVFTFRWQPDRGTWVAIGTGLLAFLLSLLLLLLKPGSLMGGLVLYGGIWVICGVMIPWGYVILIEGCSVTKLGLRKDKWVRSLFIGIGLAAFFCMVIIFETDLNTLDWSEVGRAATILIVGGGLFELFLYYGFIHIQLEKAFGPLPAILLTAVVYVLWHAGTQLPMEANYCLGALKLLGVGVMYQAVFSLTYNLIIIWPFFMGMGVMIDFIVNIGDLELINSVFPWAVGSILTMALTILVIWSLAKKKTTRLQI